jgi:hypothetical protein
MLAKIRTTRKCKVSSRFVPLPHYALNKYERANNSWFPFANDAGVGRLQVFECHSRIPTVQVGG